MKPLQTSRSDIRTVAKVSFFRKDCRKKKKRLESPEPDPRIDEVWHYRLKLRLIEEILKTGKQQ
jgi:hypothetical protein